jgi:predicted dehydrogenase
MSEPQLRVGILGAARIVPMALVRPAREVPGVQMTALAARDPQRAQRFARKHGIARTVASYEALVNDPGIDAVYNPLPNSLHARWTLAALAAGKHVLCEKPFTSNAVEAEQVRVAADRAGRVVMEAFHYRYHPLAERMRQVARKELGKLRHVEVWNCFPLPFFKDIRYQYELGGGALMDAGSYAVHMARLVGGEPRVVSAHATLQKPDVDRRMTAELSFPEGHTGRVVCSMWSRTLVRMTVRVVGERGEMRVFNPLMPQVLHRFKVSAGGRSHVEHFGRRASYLYQLEAFAAAVRGERPALTPPADSVANMSVIDAIYRAAGMRPRGDPVPLTRGDGAAPGSQRH